MIDIFKLFRVEKREDIYTYCLKEMLENGTPAFKKQVGMQFGITEDYQVARESFELIGDVDVKHRKKIIPDLVLYNSNHVSIVESKMFSSEGWSQTEDYTKGAESIKERLHIESASVSFYFLTLSGIVAESKSFTPIKWTDFYEAILKDTSFKDETLEVVRKTILTQVKKYRKFESDLFTEPYRALINPDAYWITPLTLFSSGTYNNIWQTISGDEQFQVWNGEINGLGHSEFTTNLNKNSWRKKNVKFGIAVDLFIRIEWDLDPVVWLCWEYRDETDYIPTKKIKPSELKEQAIASLRKYKEIWQRDESSYSHLDIHPTGKRASSIKALKCIIKGDKEISKVIEEIKSVINYYSVEIQKVINSFTAEDKQLMFIEEKYKNM